jgi:hypothetical protein
MTSLPGAAASSPAEPALFAALIDDAAVFPPGLAPLPDAVREHRTHRSSRYAALIGPLLVPATDAAALVELVPPGAEPLRAGLIARPGTPLHTVTDALHLLRDHPQVQVCAVEVGWTPEWRDLDLGVLEQEPALVLEVPRGTDQARVLDDIAEAGRSGTAASGSVVAKFRTGATPAWAWPDEQELAAFLHAAVARQLPFKLTGGLHHAVRGTHPVTGRDEEHAEEQHGLLNVLCAVAGAVDGLNPESLAHLLAERDPQPLAREVAALTAADAERVRALFTAYGCCGVTDPVTELSELNLIEEM